MKTTDEKIINIKISELRGINPYRWYFHYDDVKSRFETFQSPFFESKEEAEEYKKSLDVSFKDAIPILHVVLVGNYYRNKEAILEAIFEENTRMFQHLFIRNLVEVIDPKLLPIDDTNKLWKFLFVSSMQLCEAYVETKEDMDRYYKSHLDKMTNPVGPDLHTFSHGYSSGILDTKI